MVKLIVDSIPLGSTPLIESGFCNVSTSSYYDDNYTVLGINIRKNESYHPCWSARVNDLNQWVRVGSEYLRSICGFEIRGRTNADQWIKTFKLKYTVNGLDWIDFNQGIEIIGNTDRDSPVTYVFNPPLRCRSLSFHLLDFNSHMSLRLEVFENQVVPEKKISLTVDRIPEPSIPLIANSIVNVIPSSNADPSHTVLGIKLNSNAQTYVVPAWVARTNDTNQFVRVGSSAMKDIVGFTLRGRENNDERVTTFKLKYSLDGNTYQDFNGGYEIYGNPSSNEDVTFVFSPPLRCKVLALHPVKFNARISLRLEVYASKILRKKYIYDEQ
eukprot:gene2578-3193_t